MLAKINLNQFELFACFLDKLDSLKEGNSTLLDHSLIMYGSSLSVPTSHSQRDLPIILAGGTAGRVAEQGETPLDLADHQERFQQSLAPQNAAGDPERLEKVERPTQTTDAIRELTEKRASAARD